MAKARPDTMESFLRAWVGADRIDEACIEIHLALDEYRELTDAGTPTNREKLAQENLQAIEQHARELSKAIAAMPRRAKWAILQHRNGTWQTDAIGRWMRDLEIVREDVLLPLADTAKGALACLPAKQGRGRPGKASASPRDALIHRLSLLFRSAGNATRPIRRGEESREVAFIRALLGRVSIEVPDDLGRVLR